MLKEIPTEDVVNRLVLLEQRKSAAGLWYSILDWAPIGFAIISLATLLISISDWITVISATLSVGSTFAKKFFDHFAANSNAFNQMFKHNLIIHILFLILFIFISYFLIKDLIIKDASLRGGLISLNSSLSFDLLSLCVLISFFAGYLYSLMLIYKATD